MLQCKQKRKEEAQVWRTIPPPKQKPPTQLLTHDAASPQQKNPTQSEDRIVKSSVTLQSQLREKSLERDARYSTTKNISRSSSLKLILRADQNLRKHEFREAIFNLVEIRKRRTWAIAVRRGSYKSL